MVNASATFTEQTPAQCVQTALDENFSDADKRAVLVELPLVKPDLKARILPRTEAPKSQPEISEEPQKMTPREEDARSDEMLVKRFQQGDRKAFDMLLLKHQSSVARVVSIYVKDRDSVPDVVQEVFISVFKALGRFRFDSRFYTWLYRIAVNTSFNHLASLRRKPVLVDMDDSHYEIQIAEVSHSDGPDKQRHNEDLGAALERAIRRMPKELQVALLLREQEAMSYEQIAEVCACPTGTVRSRISRARAQVMQRTRHLYKA